MASAVGDPRAADASTVTIELAPLAPGGTRLRVVETLAGVRAKASVASASRWVVALAQLTLVVTAVVRARG